MTEPPPSKAAGVFQMVQDAQIKVGEADPQRTLLAARRMLACMDAREHLVPFTKLMMPDPNDPDNPDCSRYDPQHFHSLLAEALEKVERGEMPRLILILPPRHGKSQLASWSFGAWYMGRNPYNHIILASYNEELANEAGSKVREYMLSPMFQQVFPHCHLRKGAKAVDRLQTVEGGIAAFTGVFGTITGRGGDILIVDDPLKGSTEADSPSNRDKIWKWFTQDLLSRQMTDMGAVIVIMTRWHEDDVVGRLTDPMNPHYDKTEARNWSILHLKGLAEDFDPLGRKKGEALWPARHSAKRMEGLRRLNPRGFNANYQGRPTPDEGTFFLRNWLLPYALKDLPKNLRTYAASDHAVGLKQENDKTCLMVVGVDNEDTIWILPDLFWQRAGTETVVERMIDMMDLHKPIIWWGENDHIFKSIGPFLFKRMAERQVYCSVEKISAAKDKRTRAQAIRGRMAMGKVRFPTFAPWWTEALDELLKFDRAAHDDFIDPLAHIGMGLTRLVRANKVPDPRAHEPASGSIAWIKWAANENKEEKEREKVLGGF
jgi:predicted phage terminase large subunit-like protein